MLLMLTIAEARVPAVVPTFPAGKQAVISRSPPSKKLEKTLVFFSWLQFLRKCQKSEQILPFGNTGKICVAIARLTLTGKRRADSARFLIPLIEAAIVPPCYTV
jgi:hypothetical protein